MSKEIREVTNPNINLNTYKTMFDDVQRNVYALLTEMSGSDCVNAITNYHGMQLLDEGFAEFLVDEGYCSKEDVGLEEDKETHYLRVYLQNEEGEDKDEVYYSVTCTEDEWLHLDYASLCEDEVSQMDENLYYYDTEVIDERYIPSNVNVYDMTDYWI